MQASTKTIWRFVLAALVGEFGAACGAAPRVPVTHTLSWNQAASSEILTCNTFKLDNEQALEIGHVELAFGVGSHHVHVYRADDDSPDNVDACPNGVDWSRWHLLVGAQTKPVDWTLPDGVTLPLRPHQQLLVQIHWLNTTSADADYAIDLRFHPVSRSDAHLGVVFGVNKHVQMQPFQSKTAEQWCPVNGQNLLAIMGHFHSRGAHYAVVQRTQDATGGPTVYEALDESTLTFDVYSPARTLVPGDGLDFRCDYVNDTNQVITWGPNTKTQEHCNMAAYYYPAQDGADPICLGGPVLTAAGPTPTRVRAGATAQMTLQLSDPAPVGGLAVAVTSDPTVLNVPAVVQVPEGATEATFSFTGLRPAGPVGMRLSLPDSYVDAVVGVDGLVLSEVPNVGGAATWVELQNLSSVPIDLSQYSLGLAGNAYAAQLIPLTAMLPPAGCAVVGQWPAALQPVTFNPALGWDATVSQGVALFDKPASAVTTLTVPLDSCVWGVSSPQLLGPTGASAIAQTVVASGWSMRRKDLSTWVADPAPSPGICEVTP